MPNRRNFFKDIKTLLPEELQDKLRDSFMDSPEIHSCISKYNEDNEISLIECLVRMTLSLSRFNNSLKSEQIKSSSSIMFTPCTCSCNKSCTKIPGIFI